MFLSFVLRHIKLCGNKLVLLGLEFNLCRWDQSSWFCHTTKEKPLCVFCPMPYFPLWLVREELFLAMWEPSDFPPQILLSCSVSSQICPQQDSAKDLREGRSSEDHWISLWVQLSPLWHPDQQNVAFSKETWGVCQGLEYTCSEMMGDEMLLWLSSQF